MIFLQYSSVATHVPFYVSSTSYCLKQTICEQSIALRALDFSNIFLLHSAEALAAAGRASNTIYINYMYYLERIQDLHIYRNFFFVNKINLRWITSSKLFSV